jgi:hypothetical protein
MENKIVVSCFYLVNPKPGRSHHLYKQWFQNLLQTLNCNIIVFTDNDSKKFLSITDEKIIYHTIPFEELYYFKNYGIDFWEQQQEKDPNKSRAWKLSVLYNEKSKFVEKAIGLFPEIKWFVWTDIGCFREKLNITYPIISHLNENKITLLQIKKFKTDELKKGFYLHPEQQVRLGGGVQIATKTIWKIWIEAYRVVFNRYAKNSSVNCDQGLLGTLAIEEPNLVNLIPSKKTKITKSRWFYLLEYCSDSFVYKKKPFWKLW